MFAKAGQTLIRWDFPFPNQEKKCSGTRPAWFVQVKEGLSSCHVRLDNLQPPPPPN